MCATLSSAGSTSSDASSRVASARNSARRKSRSRSVTSRMLQTRPDDLVADALRDRLALEQAAVLEADDVEALQLRVA